MPTEIVIMTEAEVEQFEKQGGPGALLTDKGPLPLKALDVQAKLEGLFGEVSLTQTFVNTHAEPLEATYVFPLPDRASVTRFRMEVAGRIVEGVLKEREAARQEYDEAIEAGHRAAITEEERPGVFTMRVGNLPPGEKAVVRLTMVGPLVYEAGEVTWRFPLVVAPRYIPGVPTENANVGQRAVPDTDAVPDASRITPPVLLPGYPNPVQFSLTADIAAAGIPIGNFRASLHAIVNEQLPNGGMRIAVQPGNRLNCDFILRYQFGDQSIETALTLTPDHDSASNSGIFALTVVPPAFNPQSAIRNRQSRPRDVAFVLDRSGSMDGWKMITARRALGRMIDTLTPADRFTVLAFDEELEAPTICAEGMASATDRNRYRVIEWLARIEARGGTEMAQPLVMATEQLTPADRDRVLVLLTDGQVGNEDQILQSLADKLKGIRIFTLGIDTAVNEGFLRRLAALGGGSFDLVESEDRLDEVMDKVQRRIGRPLWTGVKIEAGGMELEADSQVPVRVPDLFAGVPLTIFGRYRGAAQGTVLLHASDDAGQPVTINVEGRVGSNNAVAPIWSRGRLRDLEDRWVVAAYDDKEPLQAKIIALSLQFGVLCRFTAFVAVDRSEAVNKGGKQQQLVQPVELPQGWENPMTARMMCKFSLAPSQAMSRGHALGGSVGGPMAFYNAPEEMPEEIMDSELCDGEEQETNGNGGHHEEVQEEMSETVFEVSLAAYRQRAREMLEELQADSDVVHALGVLAIKIEALLDDLKSIGAEEAVIAPLTALQQKLRNRQLAKADQQLQAYAEQILAEFANAVEVMP